MVAEQTLLNAAVLTVEGTSPRPRAGRRRLQRAAHRARAAAALPGRPGVAAAAPRGPRGDRRPRRVPARDPRHGARDRGVRARRRARAVRDRPAGRAATLFDIDQRRSRAAASRSSALGMGFHLIAGTLNQAALAREQARRRGGRVAVQRGRCSSPSCSARSSTTSCCAPRSATSARRRCCARCSRSSTAAAAARHACSQRWFRNPS